MAWLFIILISVMYALYKSLNKGVTVCPSRTRLTGKTVIITGCNRGIGRETALELARRDARVILACRNKLAGEAVAEEIKQSTGNNQVYPMTLDLGDFKSIRSFVDQVETMFDKVHILINNAGYYGGSKRELTVDGNEMHFQTNHLGPFLLTNLLLPKLKSSSPSRIINLSSILHRFPLTLNLNDVNFERSYSPLKAYSITKLENVLFTKSLAKRLEGSGVTVNCLHPGVVETQLAEGLLGIIMNIYRWLGPFKKHFVCTEQEGAQNTIYCAVEPSLDNVTGQYIDRFRFKRPSSLALDSDLAERLWRLSEKMTDLTNPYEPNQ